VRRVWLAAPILAALALGPACGDGPKGKVKPGSIGDALSRAVKRAKEDPEVDSPMSRVTACPNSGPVLAMVEFDDGSIAFFSGGEDPKDDSFVLCDPKNLSLVEEALARAKIRIQPK
jgi:hypothetical protein